MGYKTDDRPFEESKSKERQKNSFSMDFAFKEEKANKFIENGNRIVSSLSLTSETLSSGWKFEEIRQDIKNILSRTFGNVDVHFFGSRIIGLGTPDSDLDIFIDLGGKFYSTYTVGSEHDKNFGKLESALRSSKNWKIQKTILRTAVPIIIVEYLPLGLSCKFSNISLISF